MSFLKLESNEKIMLVLRRHWIILASDILLSAILAFLVIPIWAFLPLVVPDLLASPFRQIGLSATFIYLLFVWVSFFLHWVDYYLDVWIITTNRVLDIEQKGLFSREASEFKVERIQDVTVSVHGVLQTFMDFGDVHVQTAGEAREFIFKQVPFPERAKELLLRERDEVETPQQTNAS